MSKCKLCGATEKTTCNFPLQAGLSDIVNNIDDYDGCDVEIKKGRLVKSGDEYIAKTRTLTIKLYKPIERR